MGTATADNGRPKNAIQRFLAMESAGGILLMMSAILAVICANTVLSHTYNAFLSTKFTIGFGEEWKIAKPLILWINDGLMAVFFFLVGMEIKRELLEGELSNFRTALLPLVAAIGGAAAPALIYFSFNNGDPEAIRGWAIPTATDIAFALGLLALFGSRVPLALKVFLTAVAVIDDLFAVVIIALFYTANISMVALTVAAVCVVVLVILNLSGTNRKSLFIVVGLVMWVAVLKSGVHATIAGVVLGFLIPLKASKPGDKSMLKTIEHGLHSWVAFFVLPVFAFANAGIDLAGITFAQLKDPVTLGIALGLFFGKQVGVFLASGLLVITGLAKKPEGATWMQFYAVCMMCGIGFTMSLFIGGLAFEGNDFLMTETKLGVMLGSIASGITAYILLSVSLRKGDNVSPADVVKTGASIS